MAVEIIIGRAGTGKTFACLERIKKILTDSPLDTEIIFLLPAYQTYRAELELAQITGGAVNTRMCSFQRFARQILSEVGGAIVPRISEIGRRLLLRKILLNRLKADDLKFYKRAARQRGFAEKLSQELQELRTYAIDAEKILSNLERVEDEDLSNKLYDLATLLDDFRKSCEGKQNDESDLLEKAAELIKDSAAVKRSEIFIDGFIFFDLQQRKILPELFRYAKNVHIVLPMNCKLNDKENVDKFGIFHRSFKTYKMLEEKAKEVDAEVKVVRCEKFYRFESPALKVIEENFFAKQINKSFYAGDFKIVEAVNKRVEVEAVAQDILKLRREKNFRFRDVGIITRDDSYSALIKPIFEMHNIPFFADGNRAAAHHPLAELIRSVPEILRGWRAEPIFRCFRTGFFEVAAEDIDLLENYVVEFGLRGEKVWLQEGNWTWHRHSVEDPADGEPSKSEAERLAKVDSIRRAAIAPLKNFSQAFKKKISAREMTLALYELLESLKIYDRLVAWSEDEERKGNLSLSKEHLKIWDDVVSLFEQIVDVLEDFTIDAREFESILNEGIDALEMSLIPPGIDEVTVAKFDQNALQNSKAIYILGFNDSNFPKQAKEKFLLSDADRIHLHEDCNLEISQGGQETILAEKFLLYRGLTEAKNYLHISYALADAEGRAGRAAAMLANLKNIFADLKVETVTLDVLNSLGSEMEYLVGERKISAESARKLYAPRKKMTESVTRFESFNKCPFKYFAEYGLKLRERREYKVTPPDIGDILHHVLKNFGEDLKAEGRDWSSVGSSELVERVTKIVDGFTGNLNNKILQSTNVGKRQRERIKKVAISSIQRLIKLDAVSKFKPELFEEKFSELGKKSLVYEFDGVEIELVGVIDRVDFAKDDKYFMIIDYKTGKAYLNLTEIFSGVNLQLLTYLMVTSKLQEIEKRLPVAMLYFFLKYPSKQGQTLAEAATAVDEEVSPTGWILDNKEIIDAVDSSHEIIKIRFNNDGTINATSRNKYLQTEENFKLLLGFVDDVLKKTCENILQGIIKAKPFQSKNFDACKFCIYAELCNFNSKTDTGRLPEFDDNKKILEKMRNHETGLNF